MWKMIKDYEHYAVSTEGQVKNLITGKVLSPALHTKGYLRVALAKDGKSKHFYVHRLVASSFLPNPDKKIQVNHKDGDKLNNNLNNLEWCTNKENTKHAIENNLKKDPPSKPIMAISKDGNTILKFLGIREAERMTKIDNRHICECLTRKRNSAGGYYWHYLSYATE